MQEKKILIIKFGGLGDIILSLNAIYSIIKKFKKKKILLLTEKPYELFFQKSKWAYMFFLSNLDEIIWMITVTGLIIPGII